MPDIDKFMLMLGHRRRPYNAKEDSNRTAQVYEEYEVVYEQILRTVNRTLAEIEDSSIVRLGISKLTELLTVLNSNGISEIVCYGLGEFSMYRTSRCQLALLLCLKKRYDARVYAYDPLFCSEEVHTLRTLGIEVIETNEEGKRVVQPERTTLVYMPHVPFELINNFLYANWGDGLSNCILLVTSFSHIIRYSSDGEILNGADYILRIHPYATEIPLENSLYEEVFNDVSIHIFPKQDLLKVPPHFWDCREEPRYSDEII